MRLDGKVAVVTGGAGAIGRAIALRLARDGAAVAVADLDVAAAREVAYAIADAGANSIAVELDVRDWGSARAMAATVIRELDRIDILVNNAGGSARGESSFFHEAPEAVIDRIIDVNLKGQLYCTRAVINHMVDRESGKVVNIGSIVGVQGLERVVDYAAAKGGVIAFTRALAKEVGPRGITVNCVSPGIVPRPGETPERALRSNYLGTVCRHEDVAELVLFLVSGHAEFVTGQNYIIDGGRSLAMKGS